MNKVRLNEHDLRALIRNVLQEQDPGVDGEPSVALDDSTPWEKQLITPANTPGLQPSVEKLEQLLNNLGINVITVRGTSTTGEPLADVYTYPSPDEIRETIVRYQKIQGFESGVIKNRTTLNADAKESSRIELVKEFLRYQIMLALNNVHPSQDNGEKVNHAYFDVDKVYINNIPQFNVANTTTIKSLYTYKEKQPPVVLFNTEEFYNLLGDDNFVGKITAYEDEDEGGIWISKDLQTENSAAAGKEINDAVAAARSIYAQFDNDLVEAFFCGPILNPEMWKLISGPTDYPIYTPWRQTWVMLNILSQAMSIPGGLESIYVKLLDVATTGKLSNNGANIPVAAQNVYSARLFSSLNESRKIMVSLSELRRLINAALMFEAGGAGGAASRMSAEMGDIATGTGEVASGTARVTRSAADTFLTGARATIKALEGDASAIRTGIVDAIKQMAKQIQKVLPEGLPNNAVVKQDYDLAVRSVSDMFDDELIPPNYWQKIGSGTDPRPRRNADFIIKKFLKARRAANGDTPDMSAVESVATEVIDLAVDVSSVRGLLKAAIESGSANFLSPENIERLLDVARSDLRFTTAVSRVEASLLLNHQLPGAISIVEGGTKFRLVGSKVEGGLTVFEVKFKKINEATGVEADVTYSIDQFIQFIYRNTPADSTGKVTIDPSVDALRLINEGKLPNGEDIGRAIVTSAAAQNSQGVLEAAYAITVEPRYARYTAQVGAFDDAEGAITTAGKMMTRGLDNYDFIKTLNPQLGAKWSQIADDIRTNPLRTIARVVTSPYRMVGRTTAKIANLGGIFPGTRWSKFFTGIERSPTWSTIVGSILATTLFRKIESQKMGTPAAEAEYRKSNPILAGLLDVASSTAGPTIVFPVTIVRSIISNAVLSSVSSDDSKFLQDIESAAAYAAEDIGNALEAYNGILTPLPSDFEGMSSSSVESGVWDAISTKGLDIGRGLGNAIQFVFTPGFDADAAISEVNGAKQTIDLVIKDANGATRDVAANQTFNNLEAQRISALSAVVAELNKRKGGVGSSKPTPVTVESFKAALIGEYNKTSGDVVNWFGRLVVSIFTGSSDPFKVDELLTIFTSPDYQKGKVFQKVQEAMTGGDPALQAEFLKLRKENPDTYARLGAAFQGLAESSRALMNYSYVPRTPAAEKPAAPAAPAP